MAKAEYVYHCSRKILIERYQGVDLYDAVKGRDNELSVLLIITDKLKKLRNECKQESCRLRSCHFFIFISKLENGINSSWHIMRIVAPKIPWIRSQTQELIPLITFLTNVGSIFRFWLGLSALTFIPSLFTLIVTAFNIIQRNVSMVVFQPSRRRVTEVEDSITQVEEKNLMRHTNAERQQQTVAYVNTPDSPRVFFTRRTTSAHQ